MPDRRTPDPGKSPISPAKHRSQRFPSFRIESILMVKQGKIMEYRQRGGSGLKVPALIFGGGTAFFKAWGSTGVEEVVAKCDQTSVATLTYPYWRQKGFAGRNPLPTA
jgi:hypothetical protein